MSDRHSQRSRDGNRFAKVGQKYRARKEKPPAIKKAPDPVVIAPEEPKTQPQVIIPPQALADCLKGYRQVSSEGWRPELDGWSAGSEHEIIARLLEEYAVEGCSAADVKRAMDAL